MRGSTRKGSLVLGLVIALTSGACVAHHASGDGWSHDVLVLPAAPRALAVTDGAAWVSVGERDTDARLLRVDLASGRISEVSGTEGAMAVAADGSNVWVAVCAAVIPDGCRGRAVARIDLATSSVTARAPIEGSNVGLAVGDGSLWVSTSGPERLTALDPSTLRTETTGPSLGADMTFGQGALWGVWEQGRHPLLRRWAPGSDGSSSRQGPAPPDTCALAVGASSGWVVSCSPFGRPGPPVASPDPSAPGGTISSPSTVLATRFLARPLGGGAATVLGTAPSFASASIVPAGTGALVAWADLDRSTIVVHPVGDSGWSLDRVAVAGLRPVAASIVRLAPAPLLALDGRTLYAGVPTEGGGMLVRVPAR